jgi:hypothetical protein
MFFQPEPAVMDKLLKLHPCPAYYSLVLNLKLPYVHKSLIQIRMICSFDVESAKQVFIYPFIILTALIALPALLTSGS